MELKADSSSLRMTPSGPLLKGGEGGGCQKRLMPARVGCLSSYLGTLSNVYNLCLEIYHEKNTFSLTNASNYFQEETIFMVLRPHNA
jgi:hypothetical protein